MPLGLVLCDNWGLGILCLSDNLAGGFSVAPGKYYFEFLIAVLTVGFQAFKAASAETSG